MAAYGEYRNGTLTVREYLASFTKRLAFANFALDDPMPAIVELPVAAWNRFAFKFTDSPQQTLAQKIARKVGIAPRRAAK
jgi:predicted ATP-grasp superfamily ATP-dependent carboligase